MGSREEQAFSSFLERMDLSRANQAGLSANVMTVALLSVITRDIIITASGSYFRRESVSAGDLGTFNRVSLKMEKDGVLVIGLFLRPVGSHDNNAYNAFGRMEAHVEDSSEALFQPAPNACDSQVFWQELMGSPDYQQACMLVENRLLHLDTTPMEPSSSTAARPRL